MILIVVIKIVKNDEVQSQPTLHVFFKKIFAVSFQIVVDLAVMTITRIGANVMPMPNPWAALVRLNATTTIDGKKNLAPKLFFSLLVRAAVAASDVVSVLATTVRLAAIDEV